MSKVERKNGVFLRLAAIVGLLAIASILDGDRVNNFDPNSQKNGVGHMEGRARSESDWDLIPSSEGTDAFAVAEAVGEFWTHSDIQRTTDGFRTIHSRLGVGEVVTEEDGTVSIRVKNPTDTTTSLERRVPAPQNADFDMDLDREALSDLAKLFPDASIDILLKISIAVNPELFAESGARPGMERFQLAFHDDAVAGSEVVGLELPPLYSWEGPSDQEPVHWVKITDSEGNITFRALNLRK